MFASTSKTVFGYGPGPCPRPCSCQSSLGTRTCSMDVDIPYGHGHAAWTWLFSMNIDMQHVQYMDAQYGLGHETWTWTCCINNTCSMSMLQVQSPCHQKRCRCRNCADSAEGNGSLTSAYQALLCQDMWPWISATYPD
jgi:hypothetical protein